MADRLVEMVVESVRVHMPSNRHVVILREATRERYLPIWVGPWEASAIAMRLQGQTPERPLTHDLFAATLTDLGVEVRQVVIAELAEETFHARLHLRSGGRDIEIDSRPSDALALAVRMSAPVYAAEAVLDQAGVEPDEERGERHGASALEQTGEVVVDERLDVFRDFINSLDVDLESGEGGEGGGRA
jgi:bifunctional DNase/RNase